MIIKAAILELDIEMNTNKRLCEQFSRARARIVSRQCVDPWLILAGAVVFLMTLGPATRANAIDPLTGNVAWQEAPGRAACRSYVHGGWHRDDGERGRQFLCARREPPK